MLDYIVKRFAFTIIGVILTTFIVFGLVRIIPGDAAQVVQGQLQTSPAQLKAVRHDLRLDRPWYTEYFRWLGHVVTGDLGTSFYSKRPVVDTIRQALPVSVELAVLSMLIATLIAVPCGIVSAARQETWLDYGLRLFSIAGLSVPSFFIAELFIALPAIWFHWAPPGRGYVPLVHDPWVNFQQFFLPSVALGLAFSASLTRFIRSSMLDVLRQDYIRTAKAKGLRELSVVTRHALRNALIPVVTLFGIQLGLILGGTVIIETIFRFPGLGLYTFNAITQRDYPMLQGIVLVFAVGFLLINLIVDLSYGYLDPRIRYA
ncbi:MAG TPA: ABC transporter permease [Dehalococcoidia bacterium]|nr:ABC transporter permease [Dehalococcoidia bacterium]